MTINTPTKRAYVRGGRNGKRRLVCQMLSLDRFDNQNQRVVD